MQSIVDSKIIARVEPHSFRGPELIFFCIGRGDKLKVCTQREYFFGNYNCEWHKHSKKILKYIFYYLNLPKDTQVSNYYEFNRNRFRCIILTGDGVQSHLVQFENGIMELTWL